MSPELINNELKCLNRWLKSNKIRINADKTKYMLFFSNKNLIFPIKIGNNKINETSVTNFIGIHLDKKMNFVNNTTEMSIKVAKSIGLLYKINRFLNEIILETFCTSLIHPYSSCVAQKYGMEHIKIMPLKCCSTEESPTCYK